MRQEEGASGMSRRRKHADSPARRSTPRRAAAEDCCPAVEPGSRWSRAARDSRLCRAGARPLRRERRRAAADSGRSPGEKYKTPTRVVKTDLLSCAFSSPNDPDGQTDIFWDQNSPLTKQLGKGRRKQISSSTYTDEISHIVNRIAPQDEKPVTNSMLGVWIGDTAIPCTPGVAKEKSRVKISTKLKTQNREKELMKLAKQFDKNMEELDVIQEQDVKNRDFIQTTSEVGHLHNLEDSAQTETDDTVPKISCALIKKQMEGNTRITVVKEQDRSQKPFDQNVEAAFNAIFDGSTQMCSGQQLSQDLPDAFVNNSKTTFVKQRSLIEEEITNETLLTEKLPNKTPKSPSPQVDTAILWKSCVTPCAKKPEASNKHLDGLTTSDFEDDWESLLGNEPFLMENAEMLELFPSTAAQDTGQKAVCTVIAQNDTIMSTTNMNLGGKLRDSKVTLDLPSKTCNKELRNSERYRFLSHPSDESSKLPLTGGKTRFEKSFNNIKSEDSVDVSNLTRVNEDSRKCTFNVCASDNSGSYSRYPNEKKYGLNVKLPLKAPIIDTAPLGSVSLGKEYSVCNANQTNGSKFSSSLDDWNDPLVANEMIKACHELETTWEADDVDDDLLCQACDDIERLTQQENKGSKEAESINNTPKHRSGNVWAASKRGSQAVPSKHWNPVGSSVPSSLPKNSLIQSVKVEKRDTCGDYPNILDATTNLSVCPKNSNDHQHVPVKVNSSKFILARSSSFNVSLGPRSTEIATNMKLSTHQLSNGTLAEKTQTDNKIPKFSKFTFKTKNPQFLSQLSRSCIAGSMPVSKTLQDLGKKQTVNSLFEANQQQSSIKYSESLKPSSKGEEERNRKYSPEEIQRKRQEALVRRRAKAQATPAVHSAPIALL